MQQHKCTSYPSFRQTGKELRGMKKGTVFLGFFSLNLVATTVEVL